MVVPVEVPESAWHMHECSTTESKDRDHLCAAQEGSSLVGDFFLHMSQTSRTTVRGGH